MHGKLWRSWAWSRIIIQLQLGKNSEYSFTWRLCNRKMLEGMYMYNRSSFIICHSSFIIHHSSSIIIHHSSFIIQHSPFSIQHWSFGYTYTCPSNFWYTFEMIAFIFVYRADVLQFLASLRGFPSKPFVLKYIIFCNILVHRNRSREFAILE